MGSRRSGRGGRLPEQGHRRLAKRPPLEPLEPRDLLALFTVTSAADTVIFDKLVTLREALLAAVNNVAPNPDVPNGDPASVATNVVLFRPPDATALVAHLEGHGVRAGTIAPGVVRLMTHLDVDDAALASAIEAIRATP